MTKGQWCHRGAGARFARSGSPQRKSLAIRLLTGLWLAASVVSAYADPPAFEAFFQTVSECRLDMSRYRSLHLVEPGSDGVVISLPTSGAVRGFLVSAFYFSPGRAGAADRYGLLFNAPMQAVVRAFPEFAGSRTINGHLRRLSPLSEQTGDEAGRRRTLLLCIAGLDV